MTDVTLHYLASFDEFTIGKEEFDDVMEANAILNRFHQIHELYQIVFETVLEFENEHSAILNSLGLLPTIEMSKFRRRLNVKMLTVLTAVRAFFDHSQKLVGEEPRLVGGEFCLKSRRREKKETSFEFGFMEMMRNIAQHDILPIHSVNINIDNPPDTPSGRQEIFLPFTFSKAVICSITGLNSHDEMFRRQICEGKTEDFDGTKMLRKYIGGVEELFREFNQASNAIFSAAALCISDFLKDHSSEYDNDMILRGKNPRVFIASKKRLDEYKLQRGNCIRLNASIDRIYSKSMKLS